MWFCGPGLSSTFSSILHIQLDCAMSTPLPTFIFGSTVLFKSTEHLRPCGSRTRHAVLGIMQPRQTFFFALVWQRQTRLTSYANSTTFDVMPPTLANNVYDIELFSRSLLVLRFRTSTAQCDGFRLLLARRLTRPRARRV